MIPYIQNSSPSKILDTSDNLIDLFETKPSLSKQMNLIETPKNANDTSINSNQIDQSKFFSDKIFEKAKFNRLKTISLKSITKDIEVLIKMNYFGTNTSWQTNRAMKYIKRK